MGEALFTKLVNKPEQALLKSTENNPLSLQTSTPSTKNQNGSGNTNNRTRNKQPSEEPLSIPAIKEDEQTECKVLQLGVHAAETMPMHSETFTSGVSPSVVVSSSETPGLNHTGIQGTSSAPTTQQSAPSQPQPRLPTPQHLESAPQLTSKSQFENKQQRPEYNQANQSSDFSRKSQPRPPMQPFSGATYMQAPWPQQPG